MLFSRRSKWNPSVLGLLGINGRNLDFVYANNDRRHFPNVDDKLRCKSLLSAAGIPVPRTYHVVDNPRSLKGWNRALSGIEHFVIKPNRGYGGNGIKLVSREVDGFVISGQNSTADDITFHLLQICNGAFSLDNVSDTAYFEETVLNHSGLQHFMTPGIEGVADIRLIFHHSEPLMAMLRVPTRESDGKANLHQGGIGVGIDLATGLSLNGCYRNSVITCQPETGKALAGIHIPDFEFMLGSGAKVSEVVGLGYVGVDFVCDARRGPLVLEVNARPGLNIQIANQAGLRSRLK